MKKLTWVILLLVAGTAAFAKQHKHKGNKAPANNIVSVSLRHTACYGRCPVYTIEVNKDGIATYTATLFNQDTGVFIKNLGIKKVMEIINRFNIYRIDTCKDKYESRHTDLPGTILAIKYHDSTKTIMDANAGPPILAELRTMMDGLITKKLDNTWQKVPETQK